MTPQELKKLDGSLDASIGALARKHGFRGATSRRRDVLTSAERRDGAVISDILNKAWRDAGGNRRSPSRVDLSKGLTDGMLTANVAELDREERDGLARRDHEVRLALQDAGKHAPVRAEPRQQPTLNPRMPGYAAAKYAGGDAGSIAGYFLANAKSAEFREDASRTFHHHSDLPANPIEAASLARAEADRIANEREARMGKSSAADPMSAFMQNLKATMARPITDLKTLLNRES